jgi:DNA repair exonuclease SbcCD nuclease subunit
MKIWIISDTHFGKYSLDTDRWLNLMKSYFYDFFIPTIKNYKKEGDVLVFLGDLFDNRNSISLKVLNTVVKLFEDLSNIIECHVILGNHDNFNMNDPEINSVCTIRNIPGVIVYDRPKVVAFGDKTALMMPWIHGKNSEKEVLEKYSGQDLLFCHSDLNGCRTQVNPTRPVSRQVLDIDDFGGYGRVYSGHIHIVQTIQNFTFVGSPYHLDRNDVGNTKGIFVYNTKKNNDVFIPNDFSPEFKKVKVYQEKDMTQLNDEILKKHFVDLEISNNLMLNSPHVRLELDKICNKYKIEGLEFIDDVVLDEEPIKYDNYTVGKSIKEISMEWADRLKMNIDLDLFTEIEIKAKMQETIDQCFNIYQSTKK